VRTRTGLSNLQLFSVGNLPELAETEPNSIAEEAQSIALNTTINGTVLPEDVDFFAFDLEANARLAVEIEGIRLGGGELFDPKLRLFDPTGHEIIAEDDTQLFRQDAGFVYIAPQAGRYLVAVSEASYGGSGNSHYRLHAGNFPRPFSVTPLGGAPGETLAVQWLGDPGVGEGQVIVPEAPPGTTQSVPAIAESGIAPTELPFRIFSHAGVRETEPNNAPDTATRGTIPGAFDGVIAEKGDIDYFAFDATKGQVFDVRVWARALGSPLDSILHLRKLDNSAITGDDDAAAVDSQMRITIPEDGTYAFSVYDHLQRGGATFAYRIEAEPVQPKLSLKLVENRPVSLTVPQGNQSYLLISAARADFDGPIKVDLLDLPAGLSYTADLLPQGQGTVPVLVSAAPDAPVDGALARVQGTWTQEGNPQPLTGELREEIRLIEGRNDTTFFGRPVDRLAIAVSEPAPFSVEVAPVQAPFVHGGARNLIVKVNRKEGFADAIALAFPWLPPGIGGGTATLPGDQNQAEIRLEVRDAPVGRYKIFVSAQAAGYTLCTPWAEIEVQEPWVRFNLAAVETEKGKPIEMKASLEQKHPFEGSFEVRLINLPKGVNVPPLEFNAASTELTFPLDVTSEAPAGKFENIMALAYIAYNGEQIQHISGNASLKVYEPLPPELAAQAPPPPPPAAEEAPKPQRKTRFPQT
jgi:hypothetical protein